MAARVSNRRRLLRDVPRTVGLFVCTLIGFGILAYVIDWSPLALWSSIASHRGNGGKTQSDAATNDPKLYTGSILFVPQRGDLCTEWLLDNRNGDMVDNGQVSCRTETPPPRPVEGMSALRMRAIGKTFKE